MQQFNLNYHKVTIQTVPNPILLTYSRGYQDTIQCINSEEHLEFEFDLSSKYQLFKIVWPSFSYFQEYF